MKIIVNGKQVEKESKILTISDLLEEYKLVPDITIVEINEEIIDKSVYSQRKLEENDRVELIRFLGGGS